MHLPKSDSIAVFSNLVILITMHTNDAHWKITTNSYFIDKSDAHFRRRSLIKIL